MLQLIGAAEVMAKAVHEPLVNSAGSTRLTDPSIHECCDTVSVLEKDLAHSCKVDKNELQGEIQSDCVASVCKNVVILQMTCQQLL